MLILYNIFQTLIVILLFPLLCIYIALKSKYRKQIPKRLGFGLKKDLGKYTPRGKIIWVHALSVGEVTSAVPLVEKIRQDINGVNIIFSASTHSGYTLGKKLLAPYYDCIIPFPLDIFIVVERFIHLIKPHLFILVETDFWPNILTSLQRKKIPVLLVNGRISKKSMEQYQKFSFFFKPMFHTISHFCVQSDDDKERLMKLDLPAGKISKMGNLKYASAFSNDDIKADQILGSVKESLFIAGSTHSGEEEILLDSYIDLKNKYPLRLIIAPRDIKRAGEIGSLAESRELSWQRRSSHNIFTSNLYILDTIGELASFYSLGDICFVGGSLVNEGGHNPLEPASRGKPVLFGPHMSDFAEICEDLIDLKGGYKINNQAELTELLIRFLEDENFRLKCGDAARQCVLQKTGLLQDHLQLIRRYL